ncbi:hypothetical protein K458DRAFT_421394 [Lentithecium fluviatile CBS 122367]|uniref:DUF7708 domain-containing protein n=1 Tax=Lentithecium fluviatile CBS 122367 TaxID=1168545 RepID=A0A6G1IQC3_9PLEO|nr:hypothetical protein K458DRAFT_421394 [Lentithecium fluviatile CBS 122367]
MLRRKHGAGRIGKRLEAWTKRSSDFLAAYSGIIEIVKSVAGGQAQVPYTAISILFIVAVNKSRIQEHIESTLKQVTLDFPDLAKICEIVDYSRLLPTLESLTNNIDLYSKKAALYYRRYWFSRLWYVIRHPPNESMILEKLKADIENDAKEIRNSTFRYTVETLQSLLDAETHRALHSAKVALRPKENSRTALDNYQWSLKSLQGLSPKYKYFDIAAFTNPNYKIWKESDESALLVLQGRSISVDCTSLSWLSIASFQIIEQLKHESPDWLLTRHLFFTQDNICGDADAAPGIADIIHQIITANPQTVTGPGRLQRLQDAASSEIWQGGDPSGPCHLLKSILEDEAMRKYPAVCIVLDRIDRCTCTTSDLVNHLIEIIRDHKEPPIIKIFIILEDHGVSKGALRLGCMSGRVNVVTEDQDFAIALH